MNTDRDKRIAEALGLCWHLWGDGGEPNVWRCDYCGEYATKIHASGPLPQYSFSTFDGMGLILQKGPDREWWESFLTYLHYHGSFAIAHTPFLHIDLLQDPDRLANELYTFLKER